MKLLVLSAFTLAASTHAEVKRPGAFVPSLCSLRSLGNSPSLSLVAVKGACIGKIAGSDKEALEVTLNDNGKRVFEITVRRAPGRPRMGANKSPFEGSMLNQRVRDDVEGVLVFTSGITTSWNLSFKTTSNLKFSGSLQQVFVTQ